ncbi:MAG: family 16 glycoside hydrolase [Candidatus Hydrogenedentales bacterium]|jgi:hypothetical protein
MKHVIVLFALFAASVALAQEFQDIMPGADLSGWKAVSGEWAVKDGVLTGRAKAGVDAILISEREYADATVEMDILAASPFLAGVYIRSHALPKLPLAEGADPAAAPKEIQGCEVTLEPSSGSTTSSISGLSITYKPKADVWGTLTLTAEKDAVTVSFAHDGSKGVSAPSTPYVKGNIALVVRERQDGQPSELKFRNIKVKDLGRLGKWRPLFDGKSLDGWVEWGQEKWSVEDGAIYGRSGEKKSEGYMATKETWKDFHVRGTFKMFGEGNFGLFYHSTIKYDDKQYPVISGVQGEVAPADPKQGNASPSGWVYESYKRGWLVEPDMKSYAAFALKPGDWNEIEIKSEGSHVRTWINGIPVVDWTDPAPNLTEGAFALQLHTGGVDGIAWKDLFVED